ncbi:putative tRNA N6-adenosine threonylcarbamoyltransferase, mitochondrial [Glycine soja]
MAEEAHSKVIDQVVQDALDKAYLTEKDLTAVAVTIGPGLSLCLRDEDCKIVSRIRQRSSWTWMDSSISISSSVRNLRNLEHLSFIMTARRNSKFIVSSKSARWPYS